MIVTRDLRHRYKIFYQRDTTTFAASHLAATRVPAVHRRIRALLDEVRVLLVEQIRQLRAAGVVPEWAQPEAIADLQIAIADGLALQAMQRGRRFDPSAAAAQFAALLIAAGVTPSPAPGHVASRRGHRS
ncbi:MAG TPA: TetR family transcriptional regulator C-terminal domain-containing protein [Acidimicrobiales bacterium]|nr:TetR family transcriptional regulator C-terminal domain-containing protein [Acidimicrobiales bacterium]